MDTSDSDVVDENTLLVKIKKRAYRQPKKRKSRTRKYFIFFGILGLLALGLGCSLVFILGENDEDRLLRDYTYEHAAVAADHQTCSTIGKNILKQGGTAADAGIAAMLCVGLVNCHCAGVGGGHFSVFYNRTDNSVITVNAREKAPLAADEDMFVDKYNASTYGGLSIAVPGEFQGYYELHQRAGRLPWRDLIQPSIELARDGFPIGGALAGAMKQKDYIILNDDTLREVFCDENGNLLQKGDIIRFPKLAVTLQTVADSGGADVFYNGELAATIASEIQARDGIITVEDLAKYHAEVHEDPLEIKLDDYTVYSMRPPASGAVAFYIMNTLNGMYKHVLSTNEQSDVKSFSKSLVVVQYMLSESGADETRQRITNNETHEPEYYDDGNYSFEEDWGTSHVSVLDAEGHALALTSTINLKFGSKVMGNITGIIYNNAMDDFSTPNTTNFFGVPASPANFIKPEKRPMSSMVPMIFVDADGDVRLVTGGAGGTIITTSTVLVAMNSLWFRDDVREAVERRRIHHQLYPNYVGFEEGTPQGILTGLTDRGHKLVEIPPISTVQLVTKKGNNIYAMSDRRKSGHGADGY